MIMDERHMETPTESAPDNTGGSGVVSERLKQFAVESIDRLRLVFRELPSSIDREFTSGSGADWSRCFISQLNIVLPDLEFLSDYYPRVSVEERRVCAEYESELKNLVARARSAMLQETVLTEEDKSEMIRNLSEIAGGIADMFNPSISQK
jgi:hypothetical protein